MTDSIHIQDAREGCMMCLHYFGIFKYPLTPLQLHHFTPSKSTPEEIAIAMDGLIAEKKAFRIDNFYMKEEEPAWISERNAGEERAIKLLERSARYVKIVASFPFVRGIAISGSLSKFYATEEPDIDYFIITARNRLWIARTLLHMFKKLTFISGHEHYFCMNYFIDTDALTIEHPNLYSAIELKTLLPVYNKDLLMQFAGSNDWADQYLPNHPGSFNSSYLLRNKKRPCKSTIEFLINLIFPEKVNRSLMNITDKKWRRKWRKKGYDMNEYDRAFRTGVHISKNHPTDYQKKVLESLPENLKTKESK
jgi:hypothetical protein